MASKQTGYAPGETAPTTQVGEGWFVRVWKSPMYDGWSGTAFQEITEKNKWGDVPNPTFVVVRRKTEFEAKAAAIVIAGVMMALEEGSDVELEELIGAKKHEPLDVGLLVHSAGGMEPTAVEPASGPGDNPAAAVHGMDGVDLPATGRPLDSIGPEAIPEPAPRPRSFFSG